MSKSIHREELIVIYRQEILKDIRLFTSQPVAKFYDSLFLNLDLSFVPEFPKTGRKGFSNHAMICSFIVMKCEGFSMITDLVDYLNNNLLIAHYCGFDISAPLPSYWTFDRFLKQLDNQPKADTDCKLGVHTASNQTNEKKYEFYWGYKNHVLVDKGYDVKNIYNQVQELYQGECIIPLNKRSTKNPKLLPQGNPVCDAGLAMWKDGKFSDNGRTRQKFCCPLKSSKDADCLCHHKNFYNGKKHRGCTKYITIPDDLRLSVDRDSKYFKSNYSLRTECERYNSRFKNTGQERMWVRNKSSVTNLNTIAPISLLAVAVAAITTGTGQSYRKLKAVKRIA